MVIAGVQHGNDDFGQRPGIGWKWRPQLGDDWMGWVGAGARSGIALGRGGRLPPDHGHYLGLVMVANDQITAHR